MLPSLLVGTNWSSSALSAESEPFDEPQAAIVAHSATVVAATAMVLSILFWMEKGMVRPSSMGFRCEKRISA